MAEDTNNREIISTRVINYPCELIFNAWVDPEQLKNWWGPNGFSNTFHEFDATPGGRWLFTMHGPDGRDYENECVFVEVSKPDHMIIDHISLPKFRLIGTFESMGNIQTKVTFHQIFETAEVYEAVKHVCIPANEENLDRLESVLEG